MATLQPFPPPPHGYAFGIATGALLPQRHRRQHFITIPIPTDGAAVLACTGRIGAPGWGDSGSGFCAPCLAWARRWWENHLRDSETTTTTTGDHR